MRREQRRLKQEDNFDTAAILLGMAKQEQAAKKAKYVMLACWHWLIHWHVNKVQFFALKLFFLCLCSYEKDRARQEQLARDRIAAMKARRAAKKEKTEEEAQRELEDKLLKEQAEDSEADKRNALDMEQGGLALLQEAILSEVERKHASEQEVGFFNVLSWILFKKKDHVGVDTSLPTRLTPLKENEDLV